MPHEGDIKTFCQIVQFQVCESGGEKTFYFLVDDGSLWSCGERDTNHRTRWNPVSHAMSRQRPVLVEMHQEDRASFGKWRAPF